MSKSFHYLVMSPGIESNLKEESTPSLKRLFQSKHASIQQEPLNSLVLFDHTLVSRISSSTLTPPVTPCVHPDLHREGGMFRLAIMDHNHIPAREGHPGRETDLRLEKKNKASKLKARVGNPGLSQTHHSKDI